MFEPDVKDIKKIIKLTGKPHKWIAKLLTKGNYHRCNPEWVADLINQSKVFNKDSTPEEVDDFYMSLDYIKSNIPRSKWELDLD